MGSDEHYPEEGPAHNVQVDGFWIDRYPVTNARFGAFVEATGHVTTAETPPNPADYPGAKPDMLFAGSLVFVPPAGYVDRRNHFNWWHYVPEADWRHPRGRGSSVRGLHSHPVVHVTFADAEAYAAWEGKTLPTEAEWELAARGGLDGAAYAWGGELTPGDRYMANTWQGEFPWQNVGADGFEGTSPVDAFPPNGYGVYDMIGNVWEWTSDWYGDDHYKLRDAKNPIGPPEGRWKVSRGGGWQTFLPADFMCAYRKKGEPSARHTDQGFRCVRPTD